MSLMLLRLSEKISDKPDQSWSLGCYGRILKSDSTTKILSKDFQPRTLSIKILNSFKRNQNTTTKTNTTEIIDTTCTSTSL